MTKKHPSVLRASVVNNPSGTGTPRDAAASDLASSVVVTAGAGTGKTSLLVERLLHLVLDGGARLERIAAITFTVKAAAELRERLEDALERSLVLAADPGAPPKKKEADRVFARLGPEARRKAEERVRAAIDSLDAAAITTIHGFAGDILRRNHRAAGVDVGFATDEGSTAAELFEEIWPEFLARALPGEPSTPWRGILSKISLEELEEIAGAIASFGVPLDALGDDAGDVQRHHLRALARALLADARALEEAVAGVAGLNRNFSPQLVLVAGFLDEIDASGEPPRDEEFEKRKLAKSCSAGKNASVPDSGAITARMNGLIEGLREMARVDLEIARDIALALRPFVESFRSEHLRRGFVSFDAMILLARDLLRNHPEVRRSEGRRLDHILLDEFQDTDPAQYEIAFYLAEDPAAKGASGKGRAPKAPASGAAAPGAFDIPLVPGKLFIVGDGKQSIYRFRGADIGAYGKAIGVLRREGARACALAENFRSVPELVAPLNDLFREYFSPAPASPGRGSVDPPFDPLTARRPDAGEPRIEVWSIGVRPLRAGERRAEEAKAVASWIRAEVDAGRLAPRDVAVLFAAFTNVDVLLRALRAEGIPYVVQGGRGFYRRLEVELLLALLRSVTTTADPIPLVACLRSPLGAVPDRELALYAAEARSPSAWSLLAEPDPKRFPALHRALGLLRGFASRHAGRPIDAVARAALDETPLRLAMAASHEGAQRIANIEKAVRHIEVLARDGRLSAEEILERIEREDAEETAEGDSPLADETLDAVRVLTIHKAKGLEWPAVVLPDLARAPRAGRDDAVAVLPGGVSGNAGGGGGGGAPGAPRPALAIRIAGVTSPAWLARRRIEEAEEAAEAKRLFYVACTRARERLVLVAGAAERRGASWVDALAAWGFDPDHPPPPGGSLAGGRVLHRSLAKVPEPRGGSGDDAALGEIVEGARRFLSAVRKIGEERRPGRFRFPSDLDRLDIPPDGDLPARRVPGGRSVARAAGTAVHLLLEVWDREDPAWLLEMAPRAARIAASGAGADPEAVLARVRTIIQGGLRSGRLEAIRKERVLGREVPMLLETGGEVWEGTMDLVAGAPGAPEVVDYKTDAAGTPEELLEAHAGQLGKYREALRRAMGLAKEPPGRIISL
jgi:ATP-dependent helicase/nuclease subunit A